MPKLKVIITSIIICLTLLNNVFAETYYHKDHLFNIGQGARPMALGKSFSAIDNDVNSILFNPAGTATIKNFQAMGLKSQRLIDLSLYTFLTSYELKKYESVVGFGYIELSMQNILLANSTLDENGFPTIAGQASYSEKVYIINWAKQISKTQSIGLNYKIYQNNLDHDRTDLFERYNAHGSNIDIGYQQKFGDHIALGFSYQNVGGNLKWSTETEEKIEGKLNTGILFKTKLFDRNALINFEHGIAENDPALSNVGIEYDIQDHFSIRTGMNQKIWKDVTKFSMVFGLGIRYNGLSFDYAYNPDFGENIDPKHFFSVSYQFDSDRNVIKPSDETVAPPAPEEPEVDYYDDDYEDIEYIYMRRN